MTRLAPAIRGDLPATPGDRNLSKLEERIVVDPERQFARDYNRRSFTFRHWLQGHKLFQLPSLLELARRQGDRPGLTYSSNGMVEVVDRWEKGGGNESARARHDPEYRGQPVSCHVEACRAGPCFRACGEEAPVTDGRVVRGTDAGGCDRRARDDLDRFTVADHLLPH